MDETRRVVTVDGMGNVSLAVEPIPSIDPGEVAVAVEASVITPGSGATPIGDRRADPNPDRGVRQLGYQAAGRILECGSGVEDLEVGDRIACMGSGYALHADVDVVPQNLCVPLPDDVSYAAGAFNHLAATGLHAVRRGDIAIGEYVVVMGLGLVGQLTGQIAMAAGGRVAGVDTLSGRVDVARSTGFDRAILAEEDPVEDVRAFTDGRGIDCGVIAFGGEASTAVDQLVEMARQAPDGHRYGRIVVVGLASIAYEFPTRLGNMDVRASSRPGPGYHDPDWERGADYADTYAGDIEWTTRRNLAECMRLIAEGNVDVDSLITHRFPLSEAERGYDVLLEQPGETLGVVLEPQ